MNTEFDKQPGQRKRLLLVSGAAIALCMFVAALLERRKVAASAEAARRARSLAGSGPSPFARAEGVYDAASTWAPAGPVGEPVWEDNGLSTPGAWPTADAFESVEEAEVFESVEQAEVFDSAHETEPVAEVEAPPAVWNETREFDAEQAARTSDDDNALVEVEPFVEGVAVAEPQAEVETWGSPPAPYAPWGSPVVELPSEPAQVAEPPAEIEHAPAPDASWPRAAEPGPWRPAPAFGSWQPVPEPIAEEPVAEEPVAEEPVAEEPVAEESVAEEPVAAEHTSEDHASDEPGAEEPVPAVDHWFGSYAPADSQQSSAADQLGVELYSAPEQLEAPADTVASHEPDTESVIELPSEAPTDSHATPEDPKRLPPPRLRRFMGTGASVLVLGLVLGAGFLVSGATADSTSDPATVPDAVATTTFVPDVVADTTTTDTTGTDTTSTDTTTTDTTTTGTTTTDTTTTDTTATTTTTTPTDTTQTTTTGTTTTPTTTTPTDPATTNPPPPTDTTPVAPPASDPATVPADVPASPAADPPPSPAVTPPAAPTTPAAPAKPVTTKKRAHTDHATAGAPAKSTSSSTPKVGLPAQSGPPVVTLASGADPIGSILSADAVIPAVDASLLPTPAQVSFYVKASKPLAPLPTLVRIDHPVAQRLVAAGRHARVGWTVLAAVARLESNLGERPGLLAGRGLPSTPTGDGLAALATFLHAHGAKGNPLAPATAKKALTAYFDGSTRKADRAIALAALYGALGPAGMQHGVRAETARLQKRVLRDTRVHLTIAGRSDIRHGRVDPRVLVTLEYLANSFHKVGISDLVSGGALFSRSGSVSAHLYGRAADVSSLHGKKVRGHQGPGTMTEQAIRKLLLLPKSLRPRQVISLMDVDGPTGNHGSFALPDHYDRIQIDY